MADIVWRALGNVGNYVEPFFGSGAVLLARPHAPHIETVNDSDGFVCNFWRALQAEPDAVAYYADWPVNECDLHARHSWLVRQADLLVARLEGDPDYYDPIIAGYWVWGISCWIGGEFCSGKGPWHNVDGQLVKLENEEVQGIHRKRVHISNAGQGVHRKSRGEALIDYMRALAERLRNVRVCCGDWTRVMGKSVTQRHEVNGVFFDPPYLQSEREKHIYRVETDVSADVREWALKNGDNPKLRIVLAGYDGEHAMPETWREIPWKTQGGYAHTGKSERGRDNAKRERIWLSPHCLDWDNGTLEMFDADHISSGEDGNSRQS